MSALDRTRIEQLRALPLPEQEPVEAALDRLRDQGAFWVLVQGAVELFAQTVPAGGPEGERRHLLTFLPGQVLSGLRFPGRPELRLVLAPGPDCRILAGRWDDLRGPGRADLVNLLQGAFAAAVMAGCAARIDRDAAPRDLALLVPGGSETLAAGASVSVRELLWVRLEAGGATLLGQAAWPLDPGAGPFPLAEKVWLTAGARGARVRALEEAELPGGAAPDRVLAALLDWQARRLDLEAAADLERLGRKARSEASLRRQALAALAGLGGGGPAGRRAATGEGGLLEACRLVGDACGIVFLQPRWEAEAGLRDPLEAIARASRVRQRRVALTGPWWRQDAGPLLGFLGPDRDPVALVRGSGGYRLLDPAGGPPRPLDAALAGQLAEDAFCFHRPGPPGRMGIRELLALAWGEAGSDLLRVLAVSLGAGLLGLALPLAMAVLMDQLIPMADLHSVKVLALALAAVALGASLFNLARGFALLRLQTRFGATLQAAVVDRILSLPVGFFKRFAVGDLAARACAVDAIQRRLGASGLATLLGSACSLLNLALMFRFDRSLAMLAAGLVLAAAGCDLVLGRSLVRAERSRQDAFGQLAGASFQLLSGVAKLKVAAAEGRAFTVWCGRLLAERRFAVLGNRLALAMAVFNDSLPLLASMALFAAVASRLDAPGGQLSAGAFIAFNAAFGAFFAATVSLSTTLAGLLDLGPMFERVRPILEEPPEAAALPDPGRLAGRVEVNRLTFRYHADGPPVLQDVSLHAEPGEFIALAGPSGGGKSTLLRLLLGFERPESGGIFYDDHDLEGIDLASLRSQLGVVLQNGRLLSGSIFQNIVGSGLHTLDDAWAAAEAAGLAEDIRAMPMGMHTLVGEGGATFSGGQRQRLIIAAALVRRPRVMLFDEATSALDNRTQERVARHLEALKTTRIVIAHRLSAIRKADRIYVLDQGRIAQVGSFGQLLDQEGLFRNLVARQV